MSDEPGPDKRAAQIERYDFRNILPGVRFGTASDRYAGWIGQIYNRADWPGRISARRKKLGSESYKEQVLPTESVKEYFEHFSVVELDFTFYRPLVEKDGKRSSNHAVLERYATNAPPEARFLVKAPQMFTVPYLRGVGRNPDYLNSAAYVRRFEEPLADLLRDRLEGIIFEQGYRAVKTSPPVDLFVERLDKFFDRVGNRSQVHVEVRSPHLLHPLYFDWLETRGLGFVYSHWTWLPPIKTQWKKSRRFTAADNNVVLRLLTPRKMTYAEAYAKAHPFDRERPELSRAPGSREMVDESVALVYQALDDGRSIDVVTNNRAWGSAPELSAEIARRILAREQDLSGR